MKLHVLFHHYEDDPRRMPNAVAIMDEYVLDEVGRSEWVKDQEAAKANFGPGTYREAIVTVSDATVTGLFEIAALTGAVQEAKDG